MLRLSETSLEINGIEITFREILASAVIVLVMLILGTVISGSIKQMAMERKQEYTTAIDISSEDRFAYGLRTDVGPGILLRYTVRRGYGIRGSDWRAVYVHLLRGTALQYAHPHGSAY